jgi:hypothetical protein
MNRPLGPAESKRRTNLAQMERSIPSRLGMKTPSYAKPKRKQWLAPLFRQ